MMFLSIALVLIALIVAYEHKRTVNDRASARLSHVESVELRALVDQTHELIQGFKAEQAELVKRLAEDWMTKFVQLDRDSKELRAHVDSQLTGSLAQLAPSRGFGRGG